MMMTSQTRRSQTQCSRTRRSQTQLGTITSLRKKHPRLIAFWPRSHTWACLLASGSWRRSHSTTGRKTSRVSLPFTAAQALLLCFLQVAVSTLGLVCYLIGTIIVVAVAGATESAPLVMITWALLALVIVSAALAPTVLSLIGGFQAFQGRHWRMPLIGKMVERWLLKRDAEQREAATALR